MAATREPRENDAPVVAMSHGIDDQRDSPMRFECFGDGPAQSWRAKHPPFDRANAKIIEYGVDLGSHDAVRERLAIADSVCFLGRHRRDRAESMHAQCGKTAQIGLNTRAASGVGASDSH